MVASGAWQTFSWDTASGTSTVLLVNKAPAVGFGQVFCSCVDNLNA